MEPMKISEEERQLLKNVLAQKFLQGTSKPLVEDAAKGMVNFADVAAQWVTAKDRGRTGDKHDSSFFDKLRSQSDDRSSRALREAREAPDVASKVLQASANEEKLDWERKRRKQLKDPYSMESQLIRRLYVKRFGEIPKFINPATKWPMEPTGLQLLESMEIGDGREAGGINPYQQGILALRAQQFEADKENQAFRQSQERLLNAMKRDAIGSDIEVDRARIRKMEADAATNSRRASAAERAAKSREADLPRDAAKAVEVLQTNNAKKISIRNQLRGALDQMRNASSEDQKIVIGRQMLKTLNSTEGADAIGVEEANRLGGLLEYQILNIRNPGPMFGRDVKEFERQVEATIRGIDSAVRANEEVIRGYKAKPGDPAILPKVNESPRPAPKVNPSSGRKVMKASELP